MSLLTLRVQQMFFAASLDRSGQPFSTGDASATYYGLMEILREVREGIDLAHSDRRKGGDVHGEAREPVGDNGPGPEPVRRKSGRSGSTRGRDTGRRR